MAFVLPDAYHRIPHLPATIYSVYNGSNRRSRPPHIDRRTRTADCCWPRTKIMLLMIHLSVHYRPFIRSLILSDLHEKDAIDLIVTYLESS